MSMLTLFNVYANNTFFIFFLFKENEGIQRIDVLFFMILYLPFGIFLLFLFDFGMFRVL